MSIRIKYSFNLLQQETGRITIIRGYSHDASVIILAVYYIDNSFLATEWDDCSAYILSNG